MLFYAIWKVNLSAPNGARRDMRNKEAYYPAFPRLGFGFWTIMIVLALVVSALLIACKKEHRLEKTGLSVEQIEEAVRRGHKGVADAVEEKCCCAAFAIHGGMIKFRPCVSDKECGKITALPPWAEVEFFDSVGERSVQPLDAKTEMSLSSQPVSCSQLEKVLCGMYGRYRDRCR